MISFYNLVSQHEAVADELTAAFHRVMGRGQFVLGEELAAFETEFADYCGTKFCVGVGNGFDALTLALKAAGISPGDEVIVPANTFVATWLSVSACGGTPVPVEPDPVTYNISPEKLASAITPRTRAIVPVHLYGKIADMAPVSDIAEQHGLLVIEDAAQSHGACSGDIRSGAFGLAAAFSFYPGKNLGALGDGGAVTTADKDVYERLLRLRNYGSVEKYQHEVAGVNSRLDELQAAFLRIKLRHLDVWNGQRRAQARRYLEQLSECEHLQLPDSRHIDEDAWHLFVVRSRARDQLMGWLNGHGVQTMIHYPKAPPWQPAYSQQFPNAGERFPVTARIQDEVLSLPIGPHLALNDIDEVCDLILRAT